MPQVIVGGRQLGQETKIRQFFSERNLSAELFNKVQDLRNFWLVVREWFSTEHVSSAVSLLDFWPLQDVCRKRGLFEIRLKEEEAFREDLAWLSSSPCLGPPGTSMGSWAPYSYNPYTALHCPTLPYTALDPKP